MNSCIHAFIDICHHLIKIMQSCFVFFVLCISLVLAIPCIYRLQEGIHLCTFPEGTRSKSGRLLPFKNGAFKMAYKAGAPVVPISIVNSGKVMPPGWMFAMRPSYKNAKIIVHEPVETEGRTEEEVAAEVRRRMIEGLPDYQRPLEQDTA
uniref:Phospholipid/glycerol acyltransferase domain-containing protein n=1 Tax=Craspedostauros australis TaxID=1486917 RepID=A0A7R9WW38_9STRA|mmetsp:Transcript_23502/g.65615  ORF Transcript_23502/g.65615 Transcript_23502/m.65615 type:complete len:150 (+) Transcript_23502:54-503(+)